MSTGYLFAGIAVMALVTYLVRGAAHGRFSERKFITGSCSPFCTMCPTRCFPP